MTATITGPDVGRRSDDRRPGRRRRTTRCRGTAGPRPAHPSPTAVHRLPRARDAAGNNGDRDDVRGRRLRRPQGLARTPTLFFPQDEDTLGRKATASFTLLRPATVSISGRSTPRATWSAPACRQGAPPRGPASWAWNGQDRRGTWARRPRHLPDHRHGDERHPVSEPGRPGARPTRSASRPRSRSPPAARPSPCSRSTAESLSTTPKLVVRQPGLPSWTVTMTRIGTSTWTADDHPEEDRAGGDADPHGPGHGYRRRRQPGLVEARAPVAIRPSNARSGVAQGGHNQINPSPRRALSEATDGGDANGLEGATCDGATTYRAGRLQALTHRTAPATPRPAPVRGTSRATHAPVFAGGRGHKPGPPIGSGPVTAPGPETDLHHRPSPRGVGGHFDSRLDSRPMPDPRPATPRGGRRRRRHARREPCRLGRGRGALRGLVRRGRRRSSRRAARTSIPVEHDLIGDLRGRCRRAIHLQCAGRPGHAVALEPGRRDGRRGRLQPADAGPRAAPDRGDRRPGDLGRGGRPRHARTSWTGRRTSSTPAAARSSGSRTWTAGPPCSTACSRRTGGW